MFSNEFKISYCHAELAAKGEPRFKRVSASSSIAEIPKQVRNDKKSLSNK